MYDTTIMLKPREQWPQGVTYESLVSDMDDQLHFPGLSNSWTMPVENRLDMELTGIKTPVGIKVQGPDINEIQRIGSEIEEVLTPVEGTRASLCGTGVAGLLRQRRGRSRRRRALWTDGR